VTVHRYEGAQFQKRRTVEVGFARMLLVILTSEILGSFLSDSQQSGQDCNREKTPKLGSLMEYFQILTIMFT